MRLPLKKSPVTAVCGPPAARRLIAPSYAPVPNPEAADRDAAFASGDLVYALGVLDYDFGSEAHRDFLVQYLGAEQPPVSPFVRDDLLTYLAQHPTEAEWLTWIVTVDDVPICAIEPAPTFGRNLYAWLQDVFNHPGRGQPDAAQPGRDVEMLVSLPGTITGRKRMASGQVVPAVDPEIGGLFAWEQGAIARRLQSGGQVDTATHQKILQHVETFQRDAARELRNAGRAAYERALNFAVTAAFQYTETLAMDYLKAKAAAANPPGPNAAQSAAADPAAADLAAEDAAAANPVMPNAGPETAFLQGVWDKQGDLQLTRLDVRPSPICRPDSAGNCWDVRLVLFDPAAGVTQPGVAYQYTVDVSRAQPVVIGAMAQWATALIGAGAPV